MPACHSRSRDVFYTYARLSAPSAISIHRNVYITTPPQLTEGQAIPLAKVKQMWNPKDPYSMLNIDRSV